MLYPAVNTNTLNHHNALIGLVGLKKKTFKRPLPKSKKPKKKRTSYELVQLYTKNRLASGFITEKNAKQDFAILTSICDLLGFDDLSELDRETAEQIASDLRFYPKNANKLQNLKGYKGYDLIDRNSALGYETLSMTTVKSHIQKFSTFCNWCVQNDHIAKNYFYKVKFAKIREVKRFKLNEAQISSIFNVHQYIAHRFLHNYYYWIPLLLRYTGARLNELCQLQSEDVKLVDGVICLHFRDDDDRYIKSPAGIRLIPVHKELLAKGFWEFAKQFNGRIFPELNKVNGYYSHNASKWFARVRKKLKLGKGYDAHSFRHSFVNELKQKMVQKEVVECIVGHEHNSESFDNYSEQFNIIMLSEVINKIDASATLHIKPYF